MGYYLNVFENDFFGQLLSDDRQYVLDFKVPANTNRSSYMFAWALPPYNTVGNTTLTIQYSIDAGKSFYPIACTLTSGATQTADAIATDLNAIANFASLFEAKVIVDKTGVHKLMIQAKLARESFKAYIANGSSETVLRFNAKAGVAELPDFFARHTINNYRDHGPNGDNAYPDSQGCLIALAQPTDNWYITNAGLSTTGQADYQLLRGRSQNFMFTKNTVDGSNRITTSIVYPAGAKAGDLAKKTVKTYTSTNTNPDQITEIPYVLTSGDLVTP